MDPVGVQKKIKSNEMRVFEQKIMDNGGAKDKYEGQRNMSSGVRKATGGIIEDRWQGQVKGKTKHTYKHTEPS